eukprot:gb/GEZN01000161.1/.p1 GENE.gb/GEZN01000161.1/~~gb/GEZN01000161.1/.p1  ORF type:complete len:1189 (+),score=109.77 gb/GEZN01000161.1/:34-3600(+)
MSALRKGEGRGDIQYTLDEITYSYIFNFRTTPCVLFSHSKCDRSQPYTCSRAHSSSQLRRKPMVTNGEWNFTVKQCASGSLTDCPVGKMCRFSHAQQKEHLYHPLVFRTQFCPLLPDCPDPHCPMAHKESQLQPRTGLLAINAPKRSPQVFPTEHNRSAQHVSNKHSNPSREKSNPGRMGRPTSPDSHSGSNGNDSNGGLSSSLGALSVSSSKQIGASRELNQNGMSSLHDDRGATARLPSPPRPGSSRQVVMNGFSGGGLNGGADGRQDDRKFYQEDRLFNDANAARKSKMFQEPNPSRQGTLAMTYQSQPAPKRPPSRTQGEMDERMTPPFAPSEMEPLFQLETPEHARYIYGFRVNECQLAKQNRCPHEDMYSCFDVHSRMPRRRKPNLQHGRFNYIPTRCRYILEDRECPQGLHCRFAHCTEEVIYHPSKYKTQMCTHQLDAAGHCSGYGCHCAKAHGENDRRNPVFEGTLEESLTQTSLEDYSDFVSSERDREFERQYYMFHYKTHKCEGFPWNCQCNGFDYHRDKDRRRRVINYSPVACPNVKPFLNGDWRDPNVDCTGGGGLLPPNPDGSPVEWKCEYAHTLLELMYHPQVYKTSMCDHFDEHEVNKWQCVWKRRCAHSHGKADLRDRAEASEEWRQHCLRTGFKPSAPLSLLGGSATGSQKSDPSTPSSLPSRSAMSSPGPVRMSSTGRVPDLSLSGGRQGGGSTLGSIGSGSNSASALSSNVIALTSSALQSEGSRSPLGEDSDAAASTGSGSSSAAGSGNSSFLFLNQNRDLWGSGGGWASSSSSAGSSSSSSSDQEASKDATYVHEAPRARQGETEDRESEEGGVTRVHTKSMTDLDASHFSTSKPSSASLSRSVLDETQSTPPDSSRSSSTPLGPGTGTSQGGSASTRQGKGQDEQDFTSAKPPSHSSEVGNWNPPKPSSTTSSRSGDDGWGKLKPAGDKDGRRGSLPTSDSSLTVSGSTASGGAGKLGPSLEVDPKLILQIGTDRVRMHEGMLNIGGTAMTVAVKVFHSCHYDIAVPPMLSIPSCILTRSVPICRMSFGSTSRLGPSLPAPPLAVLPLTVNDESLVGNEPRRPSLSPAGLSFPQPSSPLREEVVEEGLGGFQFPTSLLCEGGLAEVKSCSSCPFPCLVDALPPWLVPVPGPRGVELLLEESGGVLCVSSKTLRLRDALLGLEVEK